MQLKGKKAKSLQLFVRPRAGGALVELHEQREGDDGEGIQVLSLLENGVTVVVAVGGEAAAGSKASAFDIAKDGQSLPPLPFGPGTNTAAALEEAEDIANVKYYKDAEIDQQDIDQEAIAAEGGKLPEFVEDSSCGFARLEGNILAAMREAINGHPALMEVNMGSYICFDYRTDRAAELHTAFADPLAARRGSREREQRLLRRECRGLLVAPHTGAVLVFHPCSS